MAHLSENPFECSVRPSLDLVCLHAAGALGSHTQANHRYKRKGSIIVLQPGAVKLVSVEDACVIQVHPVTSENHMASNLRHLAG